MKKFELGDKVRCVSYGKRGSYQITKEAILEVAWIPCNSRDIVVLMPRDHKGSGWSGSSYPEEHRLKDNRQYLWLYPEDLDYAKAVVIGGE